MRRRTRASCGSGQNELTSHLAQAPPDLTITKTHSGNFVQGSTGNIYTVIVTNSGAGDKSAGQAVSVTEVPPSGLTVTAMSGTGWTCTTLPTCTRSDVLAAGTSYPPITVTVSVVANATSPQVNSISVATAQAESNTANNTATDSTIIVQGGAQPIPTLSEWAMIAMGLLLAAVSALTLRDAWLKQWGHVSRPGRADAGGRADHSRRSRPRQRLPEGRQHRDRRDSENRQRCIRSVV